MSLDCFRRREDEEADSLTGLVLRIMSYGAYQVFHFSNLVRLTSSFFLLRSLHRSRLFVASSFFVFVSNAMLISRLFLADLFAQHIAASTSQIIPFCEPDPGVDCDFSRMFVGEFDSIDSQLSPLPALTLLHPSLLAGFIGISPFRGVWTQSRRPSEAKLLVHIANGVSRAESIRRVELLLSLNLFLHLFHSPRFQASSSPSSPVRLSPPGTPFLSSTSFDFPTPRPNGPLMSNPSPFYSARSSTGITSLQDNRILQYQRERVSNEPSNLCSTE